MYSSSAVRTCPRATLLGATCRGGRFDPSLASACMLGHVRCVQACTRRPKRGQIALPACGTQEGGSRASSDRRTRIYNEILRQIPPSRPNRHRVARHACPVRVSAWHRSGSRRDAVSAVMPQSAEGYGSVFEFCGQNLPESHPLGCHMRGRTI